MGWSLVKWVTTSAPGPSHCPATTPLPDPSPLPDHARLSPHPPKCLFSLLSAAGCCAGSDSLRAGPPVSQHRRPRPLLRLRVLWASCPAPLGPGVPCVCSPSQRDPPVHGHVHSPPASPGDRNRSVGPAPLLQRSSAGQSLSGLAQLSALSSGLRTLGTTESGADTLRRTLVPRPPRRPALWEICLPPKPFLPVSRPAPPRPPPPPPVSGHCSDPGLGLWVPSPLCLCGGASWRMPVTWCWPAATTSAWRTPSGQAPGPPRLPKGVSNLRSPSIPSVSLHSLAF